MILTVTKTAHICLAQYRWLNSTKLMGVPQGSKTTYNVVHILTMVQNSL